MDAIHKVIGAPPTPSTPAPTIVSTTPPAERVAALIGKYVCEEIGLADFVARYPDILPARIMDGKNILHVAVQTNDAAIVKRVLDAGFKRVVDHRDEHKRWTPLSYAAHQKNLEIITLLLDAGADPSRGGPLLFAARNCEDCALKLIAAGADPNDSYAETDETCLHCAARSGSIYVVHQLLKAGADPTAVNSLGQSASMIARELGHNEVMELLIRAEITWPQVQARREAEKKAQEEHEEKIKREAQMRALAEAALRLKEEQLAAEAAKPPSPVKKTRRVRLRTLRIEKKPAPITNFSQAVYELAGVHKPTKA